jgi:hypothetical protein
MISTQRTFIGFLKFSCIWAIPLSLPIINAKFNWLNPNEFQIFGAALLFSCYIVSIGYFISDITGPKKQIWLVSLIVLLMSLLLIFISSRYVLPGTFGANSPSASPWNAFYITTVIFTTVGFGDFVPLTIGAQYFTCGLALLGVAWRYSRNSHFFNNCLQTAR